jgi:hypothetical protein
LRANVTRQLRIYVQIKAKPLSWLTMVCRIMKGEKSRFER